MILPLKDVLHSACLTTGTLMGPDNETWFIFQKLSRRAEVDKGLVIKEEEEAAEEEAGGVEMLEISGGESGPLR